MQQALGTCRLLELAAEHHRRDWRHRHILLCQQQAKRCRLNALAFTRIKFEPVSSSYATTYFTLDGQPYGSHTTRYPTRFPKSDLRPPRVSSRLARGIATRRAVRTPCATSAAGTARGLSNRHRHSRADTLHAPSPRQGPSWVSGHGGVTTGEARIYVLAY